MQAGDQPAQVACVQPGPVAQAFGFAECPHLAEITPIAVEGMRRHLALAAQVFDVRVEVGFKCHVRGSEQGQW